MVSPPVARVAAHGARERTEILAASGEEVT